MEHLPFCVFKRTGREFYYVKFKNETGKYSPAVSTKQVTRAAAIATAYDWLRNGRPAAGGLIVPLSVTGFLKQIRTADEAEFVCAELKRKGLLKGFIVAGSGRDIDFPSFLRDFWDFEKSPYIKEKLRRNRGIHRNYANGQWLIIKRYWDPFFAGRLLGDITRRDIEKFIDGVADQKFSWGRKNSVVKAGTIPLRWAFNKEIIDRDVTKGITWFSGKSKERKILTPELAEALFRVEWKDGRAMLANLLSAITGLRAGEIQALQVQDLRNDCLNIRHSWNRKDGIKAPKNNESRTVEVPFPGIIREMLAVAGKNPHGVNMDGFVFWAEKIPSKPIEHILLTNGLRDALMKTGMSREAAGVYTFHGWRHFYTTYMRKRLDVKLLQSQTGHKTLSMVEHYSEHRLADDRERIRQAGIEAFGALVPARSRPEITSQNLLSNPGGGN